MSNSFFAVSFDCSDALVVARFWGEVLGRVVTNDSTIEHAALSAGDAPLIMFNKVPEAKSVKNRLHLDILSDSFATEVERLVSLGATKLGETESGPFRWTTFADVEGNEFDLVAG